MTKIISQHQTADITWWGAIGSCTFLAWNVACGHLLVCFPQMLIIVGRGSRKQTKTELGLQEVYYGMAEETSWFLTHMKSWRLALTKKPSGFIKMILKTSTFILCSFLFNNMYFSAGGRLPFVHVLNLWSITPYFSRVLDGNSQTSNPECQNKTTEPLFPGSFARGVVSCSGLWPNRWAHAKLCWKLGDVFGISTASMWWSEAMAELVPIAKEVILTSDLLPLASGWGNSATSLWESLRILRLWSIHDSENSIL